MFGVRAELQRIEREALSSQAHVQAGPLLLMYINNVPSTDISPSLGYGVSVPLEKGAQHVPTYQHAVTLSLTIRWPGYVD